LVDDNASPFENLIRGELRAQIEMGLQRLQEPYRTAVILRDLEGLSYKEIAGATQTSMSAVKSRLTQGRKVLKRCLVRSGAAKN